MLDLKDPEQRDIMRELLDEAVRRWADRQFAEFGKWSVRGIMAVMFAALLYLYLKTGGFKA